MEPTKYPEQTTEDKAYLRRQLFLFFIFLGATVGISLWMEIAEIWPANKFIEWQAGWFNGEFYPKLTFAVIWIIVLLAFALVFSFLHWIWCKIKGK